MTVADSCMDIITPKAVHTKHFCTKDQDISFLYYIS